MQGFRRTRHGFEAKLDGVERSVISQVVADTALLLGHDVADGPGAQDPVVSADGLLEWAALEQDDIVTPVDPALARLLPSARREDDDVAREFRRLTESEVRSQKARRLAIVWRTLRESGSTVAVDAGEALEWAGALTDVRLVLAERLGVEDEEDAEAVHALAEGASRGESVNGVDEVDQTLATLYAALSWLQETLMGAMLAASPRGGRDD